MYTRGELRALRDAVHSGVEPICPRCGHPLAPHLVPRPPQVSYVRRRTWWICTPCDESAVLDHTKDADR